MEATNFKAIAHLFLAGITAAIVYSAIQSFILGPVETSIGV